MSLARFNPAATAQVLAIGDEKSAVVVIDDCLLNPEAIIEHAVARGRFTSARATLYPGLNAELSPAVASGIVMPLQAIIRDVYGIAFDAHIAFSGYYGLVTSAPAELSPRQTIPHYDITDRPRALAVLLYLCDGDMGGTGFYRHRATGFETIGPARAPAYLAAVDAELAARDAMPAYLDGTDQHFQRTGRIEAQFNRLVIYDGSLLHSALVAPERLSPDPRHGRLTANIFVKTGRFQATETPLLRV